MSYKTSAITLKQKSEVKLALKQLTHSNKLKGSQFVAIVDENGLAMFEAYSASGKPMKLDTQFMVASHTKAMTSTLFSILHAENKIDLNKPLSEYKYKPLTNHKIKTDKISIKNLLTHTSGFTSIQHTFQTAFIGFDTKIEIKNALNSNTLVAPNYKFRYSNTGPIVSSMVAENVTGKSWPELIESKLTKPLKMNNTTAYVSKANNLIPAITTNLNGEIFNTGHHKSDDTMHASGGIISTVNDLSIWLKANINQDYSSLSKSNIFEMLHDKQVDQSKNYFTYKRDGYTLGWDTAEYNGDRLLTRYGTYGGYSIHVSFIPESKIGVISFTNQDIAFALPHVIANYAYNTVLNKLNRDELLNEEKLRLTKSISNNLAGAPDNLKIISATNLPEGLLGNYKNDKGWPTHHIYTEDNEVKVKWGSLKGTLLKEGDDYNAHFGSLQRSIKFSTLTDGNVTMKNGSLSYSKI